MNIDQAFTNAAVGNALVFLCIVIVSVFGRFLALRIRDRGLLTERQSLSKMLVVSAIASLIVSLPLFATYTVCTKIFRYGGEQLHTPIGQCLLVFGLIAGMVLAIRLRRIAFLEGLAVTAVIAFLPVMFPNIFADFFTYGTAASYYITILFTGSLLLFLALILGGSIGYLFFSDGKLVLPCHYESWIGRRFLMAKRGSHVVSVITFISVFAVMIGTAGMIVVMSVMNGFTSDLKEKILGAHAHLMVQKYGKDFAEYDEVMEKTRGVKGVIGLSPFTSNEVMLSTESSFTGAMVIGTDVPTVKSVSLLDTNMVQGSLENLLHPEKINPLEKRNDWRQGKFNSEFETMKARPDSYAEEEGLSILPGIIIGKQLASNFKIFIGDAINIVSPIGELGPTGPIPKMRAFRVAGVFESGMYEYDLKLVYISLQEAQKFFGLDKSVHAIQYKLDDIYAIQSVTEKLKAILGGYPYYTRDWMEMNRPMFSALKLEKIVMNIILAALIFMACLLILVTLIMVVIEKGKEIAILKSIGATDASIMKIFVTYGLIIGGLGSVLGLILGLALCMVIRVFGIGLDAEIYYITRIPVQIETYEVGMVVLTVIVVSFLATIPPALFAARLKPVEGLRYD